jgi:hypothetical protein
VKHSDIVLASEVGAYLAQHRPPRHLNVRAKVLPHVEKGPASHESVLTVALSEVMTMWPSGTVLVVDYVRPGYAQALAYPPALLTEIGPADIVAFHDAVELGWMDPGLTPTRHPDFESQPVWIDNPVREWNYPIDTLPEIAQFLSRSVRTLLGHDPADGYVLHVWNDIQDGDEDDVPVPEPIGEALEDTRVAHV